MLEHLAPFDLRLPLEDILEVFLIDVLVFVGRFLALRLVGEVLRGTLNCDARAFALTVARGIAVVVLFVFFFLNGGNSGSCFAVGTSSRARGAFVERSFTLGAYLESDCLSAAFSAFLLELKETLDL